MTGDRLRAWAAALKRDTLTLYLATKDPRVPLHAKLLAVAVAAYALSPIDLIPDFIPVLGLLDDVLIVPAGIWLVKRLISNELFADLRAEAQELAAAPTSWTAASIIILIWITGLSLLVWWLAQFVN